MGCHKSLPINIGPYIEKHNINPSLHIMTYLTWAVCFTCFTMGPNGILFPKLFWPTVRKNVLVIKIFFWNFKSEDTWTIYSYSERSDFFWFFKALLSSSNFCHYVFTFLRTVLLSFWITGSQPSQCFALKNSVECCFSLRKKIMKYGLYS